MIFKYKIVDIEKTVTSKREMYSVVRYNMKSKEFTFGGRASNLDFIIETVQKLFEIDSEFIEEPKFNQGLNIRWNVLQMDYDHFNKCIEMLRGNYFFKFEKLQQLKRLM